MMTFMTRMTFPELYGWFGYGKLNVFFCWRVI